MSEFEAESLSGDAPTHDSTLPSIVQRMVARLDVRKVPHRHLMIEEEQMPRHAVRRDFYSHDLAARPGHHGNGLSLDTFACGVQVRRRD